MEEILPHLGRIFLEIVPHLGWLKPYRCSLFFHSLSIYIYIIIYHNLYFSNTYMHLRLLAFKIIIDMF